VRNDVGDCPVEPLRDGTFSATGAEVANAIRQRFYRNSTAGLHPVVLRNVAANTRYSEAERARIRKVCEEHQFSLPQELGVEETNGDRLLYVCYCPSQMAT
jgi:hypothetical protein